MPTHLQTAKARLKEIRSAIKTQDSNFNFEGVVSLMKWNLRSCKRTLEDLGISKYGLEKLKRKHYKNQAAHWLRQRILGFRAIGTSIDHIRLCLKKAHAKPEDIGTTATDLKMMDFNYWSLSATDHLETLRMQKTRALIPEKMARATRDSLLRSAKAAGLSLKDLGTAHRELRELCR